MRDWNDIKDEIQKAEEPLSENAWSGMTEILDNAEGGSRRWINALWILLILLLLGGALRFTLPADEAEELSIQAQKVNDTQGQIREQDTARQGAVTSLQKMPVKNTNGTKALSSTPSLVDSAHQSRTALEDQRTSNGTYPLNSQSTESRGLVSQEVNQREELPVDASLVLQPKGLSFQMRADLSWRELHWPKDSAPYVFEKPVPSTIEIKIYGAPTYNWSDLHYQGEASTSHRDLLQATENAVQAGWGMDAGVELSYRLHKNLKLSSGIGFRKIQTQNQYDFELNEIPVIDSTSGEILSYIQLGENAQRVKNSSSNTYSFIDIPVSLFYERQISHKWAVTAEAIHRFSVLVNQQSLMLDPTYLELNSVPDAAFNQLSNSWQLKLGLRYELNPNLYLAMEPGYRSYYQDLFKSSEISWKPSDFSLALSMIIILQ